MISANAIEGLRDQRRETRLGRTAMPDESTSLSLRSLSLSNHCVFVDPLNEDGNRKYDDGDLQRQWLVGVQ
jgi:hypothetical protein